MEDFDDLKQEFGSQPSRCGECGLRGEHMPNCPGDPEPEPKDDED